MNIDYEARRNTGAFYTPKIWADLCVERLRTVLPVFDGFTFYDPAAGEGALLDALPEGTDCYASTIESKDVEILSAKGYEAEQFDFLTMNTNFLHPNILAARDEGTLVVLTNPPFFMMPSDRYVLMKRKYPAHGRDSVCLFLLRILYELRPCIIATWSKANIYSSPSLRSFRKDFDPYCRLLCNPILTPSKSWGLNGNFPVVFSVFRGW